MKIVVKDIFLKLMFNILKSYMNFIMIYHLYQKEWKLKKNVEKLVPNLLDKTEYVIYIRNLKQALNHGLIFEKVHRVIKFNQKDRLKLYIDMNIKLRHKSKSYFEKEFFMLMNNAVCGKTMENVRKHRILNLWKQKGEEIHTITLQSFSHKICEQ